ncbi:LysM domain-containing protein-like protein 2 [Colletotrichum chlorophyti]|uniref:LysM domain-containing protein-like protein 2 n=1 Tax=Colletotrichum chlorophyti TaxID=708187 RepID=A0A1Q8RV88_9PEZI|nr:LysM domain-containing protein-like protein 2 [Colletotrichum chlorophyti]
MASIDYGRGHVSEDDFDEMVSSCSVPASSYTYVYTPPPPVATTTGVTSVPPSPTPTCRGTTITVQESDTCESISEANDVATDRMIADNYLDYSCHELKAGMGLCIQDTCKTAKIQEGQTCEAISRNNGFTVVQLTSWNPTSPLFTSFETASIETTYEGGPLATTTLFDPSYTPPAETHTVLNPSKEAAVIDYTKYCWITEEDWAQGYDPESAPVACQNLMNTYCFYNSDMPSPSPISRAPAVCTPDRSQYTIEPAPDPVTTPTPHQPNLTRGCNKFHKVSSGQFCADVAGEHRISLDDFYTWNPDVGTDCRNLQLNVWVCVGYDERLIPTVTPGPVATKRWF